MPETERPHKIQKRVCEDRISSLSDDLLLQILLHVPTKDAVATMFLSKRWQFVWTMLPKLHYNDNNVRSKSVWWFLDKSMQFHNSHVLERLYINLGPKCPIDVDVVKWVAKALDRHVRKLYFKLLWNSEPTIMPSSLYTCRTLTQLTLSDKILVDVPLSVSLPSLIHLFLLSVVYKDEDSHVRLLSSCPILKNLKVIRLEDDVNDDNVRKFRVKVPSLLILTYENMNIQEDDNNIDDSLVIDTPSLLHLDIFDKLAHSCSSEYMPCLNEATIDVEFYPNGNFKRTLSSVSYITLSLFSAMDQWFNTINFSQLEECIIQIYDPELCQSLVDLLSNCPKLIVLTLLTLESEFETEDVQVLWNQPSSVPTCLSSHLEIFEWNDYIGRECEKELIKYILENSKCLDTVTIVPNSTYSLEEKQKLMEELKTMPRSSKSSVLLFSGVM